VITCGSCGVQHDDEAGFCLTCGTYLGWGVGAPSSTGAVPATDSPVAGRVEVPGPAASVPRAERGQRLAPEAGHETPTMAVLERLRSFAEYRDRPDLSAHVVAAQQRLRQQVVPVAVVGEFKRGKSTLVNALLQRAVCSVDADVVTAVPTLVRYGERPSLTAYLFGEPGTDPLPVQLPLEDLADVASEQGARSGRRYRSVEVRLPHRILRTGLCLVDTPGVGGLDSAHGLTTLGALDTASAMVFVADASQELTGPELDFLRQAVERCSVAACVLTKTDLYMDWREILERDRAHLAEASLDLPFFPVSSFLRLRAQRDPALNEESGFGELMHWLAATALGGATRAAEVEAAEQARFVVGQVGRTVEAERAVLERPQQAERLVEGLATATRRTAALVSPTATWQQLLTDHVQDMVASVEHDLQERLRRVLREVETVIEDVDPQQAWTDIEVWLRRQVVLASVENFDVLARRAEELAREVAEQFDLDARVPVEITVAPTPEGLEGLGLGSRSVLVFPGGRAASLLLAARTASFLPMVLFGVASSLLGVLVAPVSLALGAGIGAKIIRDERQRQVTYRRQQAKAAARRYVDEVSFIVSKDSRDALRGTQRQLRDAFQARAAAIHRSTGAALDAAEQGRRLPASQRSARSRQLAAQSDELASLRDQVTSSAPGAGAGA